MGRSRKIGTLAAALACTAFAAGCGASGGYTASQETPSGGQAPTTTTTGGASGAGGASEVVGAFAPADPAAAVSQFSGYGQFPKDRAGKIFNDPTAKPAPVATAPVTTVPAAPAATPTLPAAPSSPTTPAPTPVTTVLTASLDVSGTIQVAKVGDSVPKDTPQFTVQAITTSKVTLKLISGTLPGGGTTVDIGVGESVTLSNPTTGASYVVKVVEVKQEL